jgi:DNA-binding LacI/PurR family transcriptional regulator
MAGLVTGNKIPLYSQVAQTIKQRVRTGIYRPGDTLPSVRELGRQFGVSVKAIHQAIHSLEVGGIVTTHPGKGMRVASDEPCEQAAIIFGFIHPYVSSMGFHSRVLEYVHEAFAERSNFAVVRSSRDDPALERQIAEHLIHNGVKGLIVWPGSGDPNGSYFTEMARRIPVVLVDRLLTGAELPAVVHDFLAAGQDLCRFFLETQKKNRLLVIMDDLRISVYDEIARGINLAAQSLGRLGDITIMQLPITREVLKNVYNSNFKEVDVYAASIERLLTEGGYDAIFCTQDEFIAYALAETGVMDKFPDVQLATIRGIGPNNRCRRYRRIGVVDLMCDPTDMVSRAADIVQKWVLSRRPTKEIVRLKLEIIPERLEE